MTDNICVLGPRFTPKEEYAVAKMSLKLVKCSYLLVTLYQWGTYVKKDILIAYDLFMSDPIFNSEFAVNIMVQFELRKLCNFVQKDGKFGKKTVLP